MIVVAVPETIKRYMEVCMGKYFLVHMFGNIVASGTREECEMVLEAFIRYGVREDKFEIELRKHNGEKFEMYDDAPDLKEEV